MDRSDWIDRHVLAAILLQLLGYAALSALVPHSDFAAVVEPLQGVPVLVLLPVALLAVPAVVLATGLGVVLSAVGFQSTTALVLVCIYVVSVLSRWTYRRVFLHARPANASPP
jgi:hypothetical protein